MSMNKLIFCIVKLYFCLVLYSISIWTNLKQQYNQVLMVPQILRKTLWRCQCGYPRDHSIVE